MICISIKAFILSLGNGYMNLGRNVMIYTRGTGWQYMHSIVVYDFDIVSVAIASEDKEEIFWLNVIR